jgi:hypothetical protein
MRQLKGANGELRSFRFSSAAVISWNLSPQGERPAESILRDGLGVITLAGYSQ